MSTKTIRIISIILMAIVALMLTTSGIMKLAGAENVVTLLTRAGLGSYIKVFGIIELISVAVFLYPQTYKIGFLLLCCYLGGALSIELAEGQPPVASFFLVILWISGYLKNKSMFLNTEKL
jgi:hypothetical protein